MLSALGLVGRGGGRERGLAVVLDRHQALLERVSVQQGSVLCTLAMCSPTEKSPGSLA